MCERYHIVTSPNSPCPGEHNGEICFTLQQYVSASIIISPNLTLELEPGIHALKSTFHVSGTSLLEIIGDNATILCSTVTSSFYYSMDFSFIEEVNIYGITFLNCEMIYLQNMYSATISNCKFVDVLGPSSRSGLGLRTANVSIHLCMFVGQYTGIRLYSTNSSINSCDFFGNRKGIYVDESMVTIFNSTFRNNNRTAIYMYHTTLLITQSSFINNTASGSPYYAGGGAIYMRVSVYGQPIDASLLTIDRCIFTNNTAYQGGALYMDIERQTLSTGPSSCTIYRSVFINNKAISRGGAISTVGYNNISIVDSIFAYNTAPQCAALNSMLTIPHSQLEVDLQSSIFLYNWATDVE